MGICIGKTPHFDRYVLREVWAGRLLYQQPGQFEVEAVDGQRTVEATFQGWEYLPNSEFHLWGTTVDGQELHIYVQLKEGFKLAEMSSVWLGGPRE